jgi:tetratricopeptide (TPR) repeat protein
MLASKAFHESHHRAHLVGILSIIFCSSVQIIAEVRESDRALAQQVFQQLLSVIPPQHDVPWPPILEIPDKQDINAYAVIRKQNGSEQSVVVCNNGLIQQVAEGNADRLAYVLGHELAHHILGHTRLSGGDTEFLRRTFTREQELAADRKGMEIAVQAGFSYSGGLSAIRKMIDLGLSYSSFEGLENDHPSWYDRISQLDKEQASIWKSMSAFDNGTYFLLVQNYTLAERAFRQVTKDFPASYDAWANLGYSLLMEYADALNTDDLRRFDVGQIVVGGFYHRPKSLEARLRGVNEELWWDAVGALREAIRLNPDLSLPSANLGIAYLLRPAGKDPGRAAQFLEEASILADKDPSLDPVSRLAEDINLAVAYAAVGSTEKALSELNLVEASLKSSGSVPSHSASPVSSALAYNRALLLAQSGDGNQQRLAVAELETYLRQTDPSQAWWEIAYQRYTTLSKQIGAVPQSERAIFSEMPARFRAVAALELPSIHIALGDSLDEAKQQLGIPQFNTPVIRSTNLVRLDYPTLGISVIGTDEVLAIILSGDKAPPLTVREMGLGTKPAELRIGMSNKELDQVLQDSDYDFRQLIDPDISYRFYPDLGIAVQSHTGMVTEFVISQIPKQRIGL